MAEGAEVVAHYHRGRDRAAALGAAQVLEAELTREEDAERMFDEAGTLEIALGAAVSAAEPGDVVLLSPACASFDQFRDFEAR